MIRLPSRYPFAESVPGGSNGGARCSTCYYLSDDSKHCRNRFYIDSLGTRELREKNPDGTLSEPKRAEAFCCAAWSGEKRT